MDIKIVLAIVFACVLALALIGVCLWLYMITPSTRRKEEMKKYKSAKYAHRGLFNSESAENSMSAFKAARDAGFGIELDVRLSKDGKLVVFHDETLNRVCGVDGKVKDFTAEELSKLSLSDTGEGVPAFKELLALIDGRVPLIIEMKQEVGESGVAEALKRELEGYSGPYVAESFNPYALKSLRKCAPEILRGMLSMEYSKTEKFGGKIVYTLLEKLLLNFIARPDFIAYDHTGYRVSALGTVKRLFDTTLVAWTVKSPEEEKAAYDHGFDAVIFEGYIPES